MKLTIDERIASDGGSLTTEIAESPELGDVFELVDAGECIGALALSTLDSVMARYAKALDASIVLEGPSLDLGPERRVVMLRHRAFYDVIARDYLVLVRPDAEPVAALSTTIAGALLHLVRAANRAEARDD